MAFLSNSDFKPDDLDIPKIVSGGPYKGKYRTQVVHLKIKDNKKFNLGIDGKGEDVTGLRLLTKAGKDLPKKVWPQLRDPVSYTHLRAHET